MTTSKTYDKYGSLGSADSYGGSSYSINNSSIQAREDDKQNHVPLVSSSGSFSSSESGVLRHSESGLPILRAVVVVTNAALGAGMLNFPEAYQRTGGVVPALIVQACLIALILGSFLILGYCGQVHRTANYQDTVRDFCGPVAQIICQIVVVLYMFGCNVTHLILIGDQITKVIDQPGWYFGRKVVITVISCVFILPLCIPGKLKVVSFSSLISGVGALYVCSLVVSHYFVGSYNTFEESSSSFSGNKIFAAVPVICFGFQCHVTSSAVYAELRRPTITRYGLVTVLATAICTVIYSLTGTYGYLTFGHKVHSDILVNYPSHYVPAIVARAVIVILVFSTFAICHFVGRSAIMGLWCRMRKLTTAEIESFRDKRRVITTLIWFFSSLVLAIIVPTINKAIAVVGALAAHFIFTFPGLCLVQLILQGEELTLKRKLGLVVGILYVVIGMFLFGETVTAAVMEDIEGKYIY